MNNYWFPSEYSCPDTDGDETWPSYPGYNNPSFVGSNNPSYSFEPPSYAGDLNPLESCPSSNNPCSSSFEPPSYSDDENPFPFTDLLEDDFQNLLLKHLPADSDSDDPSIPRHIPLLIRPKEIYREKPGNEILGAQLFEMYYVKINRLTPDHNGKPITFKVESSTSDGLFETIYECDDGAKVPLREPLPIKGPRRPPNPRFDIHFGVMYPGNPHGWGSAHRARCPHEYGKLVVKTFVDEDRDEEEIPPEAEVCYELYKDAAIAQLKFKFDIDNCNEDIVILGGNMSVTTNGKSKTKRFIKMFSSSDEVTVKNDEFLQVDRFAFGVPLDSKPHISVNLLCRIGEDSDFIVKGRQEISVPDVVPPTPDAKVFCSKQFPLLKLTMINYWSDPCFDLMYNY